MLGSRSSVQDLKRGFKYLYEGNYKQGFPLVEARHPDKYPLATGEKNAYHRSPYWHPGVSVKNKDVFVVHEAGRGDVIHFCRYIKMLPELGVKSIQVIAAPEMIPLLSRLGYPTMNTPRNPPEGCIRIWMMSLPALLLEHNRFPHNWTEKHYLSEGYLRNKNLTEVNDKVGICWYTNSTAWNRDYRQIPHDLVENCLKKFPKTEFVPLQMESTFMPRYFTTLNNMAVSADLIQQLKAVVTIDTSILHLAGALGVKTFGLVGNGVKMDWRWLPKQRETAWYDSVTCFYNEPAHEWRPSLMSALEEACR